ncbi:hypothetical protein JCM11251_002354 [Rhodosporidiobolus azoricus]
MPQMTEQDVQKARTIKRQIAQLTKERHAIRSSPDHPFAELDKEKHELAHSSLTAYKALNGPEKREAQEEIVHLLENMEELREEEDEYDEDLSDRFDEIRDEIHELTKELLAIPGAALRELSNAYKAFHQQSTSAGTDAILLSTLLRRYFLEATCGKIDSDAVDWAWLKFSLLSHYPGTGEILSEALKTLADAVIACKEQEIPIPNQVAKLLRGPVSESTSAKPLPATPPPPLEFTSRMHKNKGPHVALQAPGQGSSRRKHRRRPSNLQHMRRADSISDDEITAHSLGQLSRRQRAIYGRAFRSRF